MSKKLMIHMVFGYPNVRTSGQLLQKLDRMKIDYIEIQIPFSDPVADGPVLARANAAAAKRVSATNVFEFLESPKSRHVHSKIVIMCYFQTIFSYGLREFCKKAARAGVIGLIVPDLPFDQIGYHELTKEALKNNLILIPVVSPNSTDCRLEQYVKPDTSMVYLTSRSGVTGVHTTQNNIAALEKACTTIKNLSPKCQLILGFGIQSAQDIRKVPDKVETIAIGSSITKQLESGGVDSAVKLVQKLVEAAQLR